MSRFPSPPRNSRHGVVVCQPRLSAAQQPGPATTGRGPAAGAAPLRGAGRAPRPTLARIRGAGRACGAALAGCFCAARDCAGLRVCAAERRAQLLEQQRRVVLGEVYGSMAALRSSLRLISFPASTSACLHLSLPSSAYNKPAGPVAVAKPAPHPSSPSRGQPSFPPLGTPPPRPRLLSHEACLPDMNAQPNAPQPHPAQTGARARPLRAPGIPRAVALSAFSSMAPRFPVGLAQSWLWPRA